MSRFVVALILSFALSSAHAANYTVTRLDDPAPDGCQVLDCSLREAVLAANQNIGSDLIELPAGELTLDWTGHVTGEITVRVTDAIHLRGAGAGTTRVAGRANGRLFDVTHTAATFEAMTMRGGRAVSPNPSGGGIRGYGAELKFVSAVLTGNRAQSVGGAIDMTDSTLELLGSEVSNSQSDAWGGGIYAYQSVVILRKGSVISGNAAASVGGGAAVVRGELIGDDTSIVRENRAGGAGGVHVSGALTGLATQGGSGLFEISRNSATAYGGGIVLGPDTQMSRIAAIDNEADRGGGLYVVSGVMSATDSVIAVNQAHSSGGGVVNSQATLDLTRVSIEGNVAGAHSGALYVATGRTNLRNVDVFDNAAPQRAGLSNSGGRLEMAHVTISGNFAGHANDAVWIGTSGSGSYANSILAGRCTGTTSALSAPGRNLRTTSLLGSNCAGTTATSAELALRRGTFGGLFEISGTSNPASVLVDAGSVAYCEQDDVRGVARDAACDIGAFEF